MSSRSNGSYHQQEYHRQEYRQQGYRQPGAIDKEAGLLVRHPTRRTQAVPTRNQKKQDASVLETEENDQESCSSSDDGVNMSLADRIAKRGQSTANQQSSALAKTNSMNSAEVSITAKEPFMVKRARATMAKTKTHDRDEEQKGHSPSPMHKKKKSRVVSPRAAKEYHRQEGRGSEVKRKPRENTRTAEDGSPWAKSRTKGVLA
jgi:hypothetical protein